MGLLCVNRGSRKMVWQERRPPFIGEAASRRGYLITESRRRQHSHHSRDNPRVSGGPYLHCEKSYQGVEHLIITTLPLIDWPLVEKSP